MNRFLSLQYYFICSSFWLLVACHQHVDNQMFRAMEPSATGINFKNLLRESPEFNVLNYSYFYNGGGVAVGDINNDGLVDIYFTGNMMASHLYLNKGDFKFKNIAKEAGVEAAGLWNTGVTMADVNNDGWLDIYVCRSAANLPERRRNLLFINNRDLTFTEMGLSYGLADPGYSTQAVFFDYDRDGDLDMYLLNHSVQEYAGFSKLLSSYKEKFNPDYGDKLFRNDLIPTPNGAIGRFTDVSVLAGIKANVLGFGLGVATADLNNDGWLDIYVSNDYNEEDYLYLNQKDGTFKETVREHLDYTSLFSMGSDVADINNDGHYDIYTLDMLPEDNYRQKMTSGTDNYDKIQTLFSSGFHKQSMRNMLQLNHGDGTFSEIGQLAGISNTDWSWSALFADFDLDGWKDLYVTNGYKADYTNMDFMAFAADQQIKTNQTGQQIALADLLKKIPAIETSNYAYKNNGDLTFMNATKNWGLEKVTLSNGAAYADLDNDGDLDLITNDVNAFASVYRNRSRETNPGNHFLKLRFKGDTSNLSAFGTRVDLFVEDALQTQTLINSRGYQSAVAPELIFGLGPATKVDSLFVQWSNGSVQWLRDVPADQTLTVIYGPQDLAPRPIQNHPLFTQVPELLNFQHRENDYNDFRVQPLLHLMLSTQGPGLAAGDVNADQRDDIFLTNGRGSAAQLFLQEKNGTFRLAATQPWIAATAKEGVEAIFFDADQDTDLDLYVGYGGSEFAAEDAALQDELYLNDGKGNFSLSSGALPVMLTSTGVVKPVDVDGDGDQDLFVSGRNNPGRYPSAPRSYLLINDGQGQFTDQTETWAPQLVRPGMVTGAGWTDLNQDQRPDLIIAGEWMPVSFWVNDGKQLFQQADTSLAHTAGWWSALTLADLDGDGDQDIILGNHGLNSQARCSARFPATLHAADFDGNGSVDPIISCLVKDGVYPLPAKDDLLGQLVRLKKPYLHYEDYARSTLPQLLNHLGQPNLAPLQATTLASAVIWNEGALKFRLEALPLEAQVAPVYAALADDFNGDKHMDILLAGNFHQAMVKLGLYDALKGLVLAGDGRGGFKPLPYRMGGAQLQGAVRDIALIQGPQGQKRIIIAKNSAPAQIIELN